MVDHWDIALQGEEILKWVQELGREAERLLAKEANDSRILENNWSELQELRLMVGALRKAGAVLSAFPTWAETTEHRATNGEIKIPVRRVRKYARDSETEREEEKS